MGKKNIKLDFSTEDVMMNPKNSICIKGQEVPTMQYVWKRLSKVESDMRRLSIAVVVWGLSVMVLAITVVIGKL